MYDNLLQYVRFTLNGDLVHITENIFKQINNDNRVFLFWNNIILLSNSIYHSLQ